ncbi:MAG: putative bifunctional diguanylate cyclase/phosphodiesterase [Aeromonas sp.]
MKQHATPVMWFFNRQQETWHLTDLAADLQWQAVGVHPWFGQLLPEDETGFAHFLRRLEQSHLPHYFLGHLKDNDGAIHHMLWSGQWVPHQQECRGRLVPLDSAHHGLSALNLLLPMAQTGLLAQLAPALSACTGLQFFTTLVDQLAHILKLDAVWVGEPAGGDRIKVLIADGLTLRDYLLAGTPCQGLYQQRDFCITAIDETQALQPWLRAGQTYYGQPLIDDQGQLLGHLAMLGSVPVDMSELTTLLNTFSVRMAAELQRLQADAQIRLSAVAFETHVGIIITDPSFNILRVNHAFTHITGFTSQGVLGLQLAKDLWPDFGEGCTQATDREWQGETLCRHFDGHTYPQWERVTPVHDEQGAITHFVICFEDISARKAAEQRIEDLAYYGELTGLPNRRQLHDTLRQRFNQATRDGQFGALLFIDLAHFKTINDSLGHATGDWLLKAVAARLKKSVQSGDYLAHLGGDEFVLLLAAVSSVKLHAEQHADLIAAELIADIAAPYVYDNQVLHIGASIGITLFPDQAQKVDDLLKQAGTAVYQAKSAGDKTRRFFDASMEQQAVRRLQIHNDLRNALSLHELSLHYQPQHNVESGALMGVEALIRWQPAGRAMISPAEFIPIAEETDLIVDIGNWVLHEACSQYVRWQERGIHIPQISVNVSAKQFHAADFVAQIHDVLGQTGMNPACLNLEITESVVLGHAEDTISKMTELKGIGISFAIDDFGAGYSSLSYLKRLPANELKIDRAFIQDIPNDSDSMAIVEAVIAMARHMGFNVTAEGVESRQQLEFLQGQGCHFYQGYFISKPLPVPYLEKYVQRLTKPRTQQIRDTSPDK